MSWSTSPPPVKPPCGVKRRRLCCPQALRSRKLRRDTRFHYLYGYLLLRLEGGLFARKHLANHRAVGIAVFFGRVYFATAHGVCAGLAPRCADRRADRLFALR